MLQQILKDMYIDPDILEALNDDQKKTLFLKMRQEQVRRWKEHEENEAALRPKPKTGNRKNVSWLLGRDGDVAVMVIGEVDELKTSKLICAGSVEKKTPPSLLNNSSYQINPLKGNLVDRADPEPDRTRRDNLPPKILPATQLNLKENGEEVRTVPPPEVIANKSLETAEAELRQELEVEDTQEEPILLSYRPHPSVNDSTLSPLKTIISPPVPHSTLSPVLRPTSPPVLRPTPDPVLRPTPDPVLRPTPDPVFRPTPDPVLRPTPNPVLSPTPDPVLSPTPDPVLSPTPNPVLRPKSPPVLKSTSSPVLSSTLSPIPNAISSPVLSTSPPVPISSPPVSKSTLSPVISSTLSPTPNSTSPILLRSAPALNTTYPHVPSSTSPPVSSINIIRAALEKSTAKGRTKDVTPPLVEPPSSVPKTTTPTPVPSATAHSPIPKTTSPILSPVTTSPSPCMEPSNVPNSPRSLVPIIYTPAPFHKAVGASHVSSSAAIRGSLKSFAKTHSQDRHDVTSLSFATRLHLVEPADPQEVPSSRDIRVMAASHRAMSEDVASEGSGDTITGRGRVAQLMKTFSVKSPAPTSQSPPRSNKPPIPTKPSHLSLAASPALR